MKSIDKEGYLLIEKEFTSRGFNFSFVKDFKDGWMIYKKTAEGGGPNKYELIRPKKQEEFNFRGSIIPKKWKYPNDNDFGRLGFDCASLEAAKKRHDQIIKTKQDKEEKEDRPQIISIPNKEFTCKDLMNQNSSLSYSEAYAQVKTWATEKKILKVGEKKNKKGKSSILYKKAK